MRWADREARACSRWIPRAAQLTVPRQHGRADQGMRDIHDRPRCGAPRRHEELRGCSPRPRPSGSSSWKSSGMRDALRVACGGSGSRSHRDRLALSPGTDGADPDFINRRTGARRSVRASGRWRGSRRSAVRIMVYQEQIMQIASEMGGLLPWARRIPSARHGKKEPRSHGATAGGNVQGLRRPTDPEGETRFACVI